MSNEGKNRDARDFAPWLNDIRGRISDTLGAMIEKKLSISFQSPRSLKPSELDKILQEGPVAVSLPFGPEIGWHLLMPQSLAAAIADFAAMGDGTAEFSAEAHSGTLQEIFGQVGADIEPEISTLAGDALEIQPAVVTTSVDDLIGSIGSNQGVIADINVEGLEPRQLILLFEQGFSMLFASFEGANGKPAPKKTKTPDVEEMNVSEPPPPTSHRQSPVARPASFEEFGAASSRTSERIPQNIDSLLDISLPITIELGRTKMLIREVLDLGPGSVIELDKLSGEPVDLFVNDKKFARGEVVVIEENFGVRITELIKVEERIKALK